MRDPSNIVARLIVLFVALLLPSGCGSSAALAPEVTVDSRVTATITADGGAASEPTTQASTTVEASFAKWAIVNGSPYRDLTVSETSNDGSFASLSVIASFRDTAASPWEERQAEVECRNVGSSWQCDDTFAFTLSQAEVDRTFERTGIELVRIPAGEFLMGSSEEQIAAVLEECKRTPYGCQRTWFVEESPQHTVMLDEYLIGKTPITNAQYALCVSKGGCTPPRETNSGSRPSYYNDPAYSAYPVTKVDWAQADTYCRWAGGRLPTEAEWEKAARGTDGRFFPWGDSAPSCKVLNYYDFSDGLCVGDTSKVGAYPEGASPYGVLDMAGNIEEWVNDWYGESYYSKSPAQNPRGPEMGNTRVLRGGSWQRDFWDVRTTSRLNLDPAFWLGNYGFRCAH